MDRLPDTWAALAGLVFLLGLKHGFDADHLATIDGLTRSNARAGRRFARYCGGLFSLGHGLVVVAIATIVGTVTNAWHTPAWLEVSGNAISIGFLVWLGLLNLRALRDAPADAAYAPVGLKAGLFGRLATTSHPLLVMGVGAFFALSFDTVSEAALFSLAAGRIGGIGAVVALGLVFTAGMLLTDAVNGLWIARLIRSADRRALVASRVMGAAIAIASLGVAGFSLARWLSPGFEAATNAMDGWLGLAVVATVGGGALVGGLLASRVKRGVGTATNPVAP